MTKQADRRLIRFVYVRRPPIEAPELDHNLVYAKVRIPRSSTQNRRKSDSTKETPKTADLRGMISDPNLRCYVANAMVAALPPIPDGSCISDIVTDMAAVMLSTAAELARALSTRAEHSIGARGPVWRPRQSYHGNRERRRGGIYAKNLTTATFERP